MSSAGPVQANGASQGVLGAIPPSSNQGVTSAEHSCPGCNPHQGSSSTPGRPQGDAVDEIPEQQRSEEEEAETDEARAARVIQKHYRRHAARQRKTEGTDAPQGLRM